MTNLTASPGWSDVLQLETSTAALGGPGGPMNLQAQALLNRFAYLATTDGATKIGYDGETLQTLLDDAKAMAAYASLRAYSGRATSVRITTVGIAGFFKRDASDTTSADNGGTVIVDAIDRRWKRVFSGALNLKWFGALGNNSADDTAAILAAKAAAVASLPCTIIVPAGTYRHTDLGNWAYRGLWIVGENHRACVFKRISGTGSVFKADAFAAGLTGNDATAPFIQSMNVMNLTFEGNSGTAIGIDLQGLARCDWQNVFYREGDNTAGIAWKMRGCMLNTWKNIGCSTDLDTMASAPYQGLQMEAGTRDSVNIGNCSNNTFINPYFEGLERNGSLHQADQTVIVGGCFESGGEFDLLVGVASRYNTLIGVGFESTTVTANVVDAGVVTRYLNCYTNKKLTLQGRGAEVSGGYHQRIEIESGAVKNHVHDVIVKNWESSFPGTGGFFNSGTATEWKNIYDIAAAVYVYPLAARVNITVTASPFTFTNNTGQYVEVAIQSGTVSQVRQNRAGDLWLKPAASPTVHLLPPGDALEVTYSVAPAMSYVPHNGFQG